MVCCKQLLRALSLCAFCLFLKIVFGARVMLELVLGLKNNTLVLLHLLKIQNQVLKMYTNKKQ